MRRFSIVVALALTVCFACGSVRLAPALSSPSDEPVLASPAVGATLNVYGTLDRGTAQMCPSGDPCDPVMVGSFVVFSQAGKQDVRTTVSASGEFALHLDPGSYTISAAPLPINGRLQPSTVRVPAAGKVALRLVIT